METEEQENGDLIITFSPTELKNLGWKEEGTFNIIVNEDGTITVEKMKED